MNNGAAIANAQAEINRLKQRVVDLQEEISALNRKREALFDAQHQADARYQGFDSLHHQQRARLEQVEAGYSVRLSKGYSRLVKEQISGAPAESAYGRFADISQTLGAGVRRLGEDILDRRRTIEGFEAQISYLQGRVTYLRGLL